ncbi:MAG: YjgN family protein, partial [Pseudomonadota bacterium]
PVPPRLEHIGRLSEVVPLALRNAILSIVTLLIYRFWARTDVRRYLWDRTRLSGDRFEWTGTGSELFLGFLTVGVFFILPLVLMLSGFPLFFSLSSLGPGAFSFLFLPLIGFLLYGFAMYRARRYRFSRTAWRGIRFGLGGSALGYGLRLSAYFILTLITLGWFYPAMSRRLTAYTTNRLSFGDRAFAFEGRSGPLYPRFALIYFAGIFVFGGVIALISPLIVGLGELLMATSGDLAVAGMAGAEQIESLLGLIPLVAAALVAAGALTAYKAREYSYFAQCTTWNGMQLKLSIAWLPLFWLSVSNALIVIFTLGIATPIAQFRKIRFLINRLEFAGPPTVPEGELAQNQEKRPRLGEGMAEFLGFGTI